MIVFLAYVDDSNFSSRKTLAMLGVRYVVSADNDIAARNGYHTVGSTRTAEDGEVVILKNQYYMGSAVLLAGELNELREEQFITGCSHRKILCRDCGEIYNAIERPVPENKGYGLINIDISSIPISSGMRYVWVSSSYQSGESGRILLSMA